MAGQKKLSAMCGHFDLISLFVSPEGKTKPNSSMLQIQLNSEATTV